MSGKAAKIQLTTVRYEILLELSASRSVGSAVVTRANIVLMAFQKLNNQAIAKAIGLSAKTVGLWRSRWQVSYPALLRMQFAEPRAAFRRAIIECLCDAPRCGSPGKFTAEQIVGVIAIACEPPEKSDRPVTTWTGRELADEAQKRNLLEWISPSHVNRILRAVDLQPHRRQYWCNTTEKDHAVFQQQVEEVCRTYLEAPRRYAEENTRTVCVDEMTSIQALERRAATKLPLPGQVAKEEFQYTRHGVACLTANGDVVEGQLIAPTISETRDNHDFAQPIAQTIAIHLTGSWIFLADCLNTHCGAPLVRRIAKLLGIDAATLGVEDKSGILKSMKTRREFLSDPNHRIRFVYLPKHSSWLNQIEIIFGTINRRVTRRGNFVSREDLIEKLKRFIAYFNETIAKPMNWTYTGRPTGNQPTPRPKTWRELRQADQPWKKLALVRTNL